MEFGDVVTHGVFGATGFVAGEADLAAIEQTIQHNMAVLSRFAQVVVATNYASGRSDELMRRNRQVWRRWLPDCVLIDSAHNRGHSIGTADLENLLFEHTRSSGLRWLCKSANDILLWPEVMHIQVPDAGFYFMNAVSFDAIRQRGFDLRGFTDGFFYPQTTFYAIDTSLTDYLYDQATLDQAWETVTAIPGYNGRIWEHLPGWSCELLMRECVVRNGLARSPLMTDAQWRYVVDLVIDQRIHDCSFKALRINGICHAQGLTSPDDAQIVPAL